jgi:hypothetical protein
MDSRHSFCRSARLEVIKISSIIFRKPVATEIIMFSALIYHNRATCHRFQSIEFVSRRRGNGGVTLQFVRSLPDTLSRRLKCEINEKSSKLIVKLCRVVKLWC